MENNLSIHKQQNAGATGTKSVPFWEKDLEKIQNKPLKCLSSV